MKILTLVLGIVLTFAPQALFGQGGTGSTSKHAGGAKDPKSPGGPTSGSVTKEPPPPAIDPDFSRILMEAPPPKLQHSLVYLDESGTNWVLNGLGDQTTQFRLKGGTVRTIPPLTLGKTVGTCYGQGAQWAIMASPATQTLELYRFDFDLPGDGWKKAGTFDGEGGIPSILVPLKKENRFIGISFSVGLRETGTERASFVGVFRNKEGKLSLESCVELPFDDIPNIMKGRWFNLPNKEAEVTAVPEGERGTLNRLWLGYAEPRLLTPTLVPPSISEDFLVLGAASAGVLWILDLDSGRVRRTINLTGLDRKELLKLSPLKHVILGTGFAPDGSLIVAAKPPDLIELTVALDLDKPDSPEKGVRKKDFESLRNEIKDISWWRIDLKNGVQERLDSPVDFPERMPTAARQAGFRFLVDPYGYVKTNAFMPWSKVMEAFFSSIPGRADGPSPTKDEPRKSTPPQ